MTALWHEHFCTRVLSIRLDAKTANPDKRTFTRSNIGAWCRENRSIIIHACLTIILAAKDVETDLPPSRYNGWDKFVRRPLFIATGVDIADLFDRNKDADPKIEGQIIFLEAWNNTLGNNPVTAKDILQGEISSFGENNSEIGDAIRDIFGGIIPTSSAFGKWLGGLKDRVIGGYKVAAEKSTSGENKNRWLWKVEQILDSNRS